MFGWMKRRAQMAHTKSSTEDFNRLLTIMRAQTDAELGSLRAFATVVRLGLLRGRTPLLSEAQLVGSDAEREQAFLGSEINEMIEVFQKRGGAGPFCLAAGAMVWLFTQRALVNLEVRGLGREMWSILTHAEADLETQIVAHEILIEGGWDISYDVFEAECMFVPEYLMPLNRCGGRDDRSRLARASG
jgi:hypothetical protein